MADLDEKARRAAEEWLADFDADLNNPVIVDSLTAAFKAFAEEARARGRAEERMIAADYLAWRFEHGVFHDAGAEAEAIVSAVRAGAPEKIDWPTQGEKREGGQG